MKQLLFAIFIAMALAPAAIGQAKVPGSDAQIRFSFAPVVKKSAPSVVNIYAKRVIAAKVNPFSRDPFFSDFFRNFGPAAPQVQNSLGSGVILSSDGLVVSNYHVVGGATQIRVVLSDRREFDAKVLLADKTSDLAVLKLKGAKNLPAMPLRRSNSVEVGDLVLAIGNPFGVGQTVSSGIISGLARSGGAVGNARAYFIQTDAPINPGNSGGALVDMSGALVGINTSILTRSGGSNGIGFAIPADLVAQFLKQARAGNTVFQRPWAGMIGQRVGRNVAESLNMSRPEGLMIAELHPASPFAKAGLSTGDVILSFNGAQINGPAELLYRMSVLGVGQKARIRYLSGGVRKTAVVRMILPPKTPESRRTTIRAYGPFQGLTLAQINPALVAKNNLPLLAKGVAVVAVKGTAARIGFQRGDILRRVNGRRIRTISDALKAVRLRGQLWDITIVRGGQRLTMRLRG